MARWGAPAVLLCHVDQDFRRGREGVEGVRVRLRTPRGSLVPSRLRTDRRRTRGLERSRPRQLKPKCRQRGDAIGCNRFTSSRLTKRLKCASNCSATLTKETSRQWCGWGRRPFEVMRGRCSTKVQGRLGAAAAAADDPLALVVFGVHASQNANDRFPWDASVRRGSSASERRTTATPSRCFISAGPTISALGPLDKATALMYYQKAATAGESAAMDFLGWEYQKGGAAEQQIAVAWYRRAADLGLSGSMDHVGFCYQQGIGVPVDPPQAVQWYQRSAAPRQSRRMNNLAYYGYEQGNGVSRNIHEAIRLYREAAARGHIKAMENLRRLRVR